MGYNIRTRNSRSVPRITLDANSPLLLPKSTQEEPNSCQSTSSVATLADGASVSSSAASSSPVSATVRALWFAALRRLVSRVAVLRAAGGSAPVTDESSLNGVDENDPRSIARWVRKMSTDMGEPLDPETEADLERLEAGDMPDDFADDSSEEEFAGVE